MGEDVEPEPEAEPEVVDCEVRREDAIEDLFDKLHLGGNNKAMLISH